jgi:hypothetical protein
LYWAIDLPRNLDPAAFDDERHLVIFAQTDYLFIDEPPVFIDAEKAGSDNLYRLAVADFAVNPDLGHRAMSPALRFFVDQRWQFATEPIKRPPKAGLAQR